jgi:hypothetical protein
MQHDIGICEDTVITVNDEATLKLLATNLQPAIEAGAQGIAAAVQNVLAPYPKAAPRRAGKSYYVRGKGLFSANGTLLKSSEMLNRRWSIRKVQLGARLRNTASYAAEVHGRRKQRKLHARRGWMREDEAIKKVVSSGEAEAIMDKAIDAAFKRNAK